MRSPQTGQSQEFAAVKSGVSVRFGRRIERGERNHVPHSWRIWEETITDPHDLNENSLKYLWLSLPPHDYPFYMYYAGG